MYSARIILRVVLLRGFPLWRFLSGALHPRRRTGGRRIVRGWLPVLVTPAGARLDLLIGATHAAERIGLADQPRQFGQRIALALVRRALVTVAIIGIIGGEKAGPVSVNPPDDACPSRKTPTPPPQPKRPPPHA